jgi:adenosylmethionine-8-amino-7-oxononanoate aminotransferase
METFQELRGLANEHVFTPNRPWSVLTSPEGFNIFTEASGRHITDMNGKTYLDFWGSVQGCNLLGYGRKEIADAAYEQMLKFQMVPTHDGSIPKIKLAKKLADITPGSLSKVFFANGGTEAIEAALKLARKYQRNSGFPNKYKVIGPCTYHGSTPSCMAINGNTGAVHFEDFEPLPHGYLHVAHPWCSRCSFGLTYPNCDLMCAKQIEQVIRDENPETVSAFIDTPIDSLHFVPPPEYWPMVRSICDKYGLVLIFDCIVTGFGRTGKMFAAEHFNVVPDIMAVGKGLASSFFPISAAIVTRQVAQKFEGGPKETLIHSYTFEGLASACAAALATLDIVEKEKLVDHSKALGEYLFNQLQSLYDHNIIGEIRAGLGLMAGVELFKNRRTKEKFSPDENAVVVRLLKEKCTRAGLWGLLRNPFSICPALTITKDEIDEMVSKFNRAIGEIGKEMNI